MRSARISQYRVANEEIEDALTIRYVLRRLEDMFQIFADLVSPVVFSQVRVQCKTWSWSGSAIGFVVRRECRKRLISQSGSLDVR